jgi:ferrous iron transport protein A
LKPDELTLKLMEMGCLPGAEVEVRHVAPFGDPLCVRVAGYLLSLRKAEAATLLIEH